jgi:elongator complex protein 4
MCCVVCAVQDEVEGGKEREDFKLRIAWQYRRYIQGGSRVATQPTPTPGRSGGGRSRASGGEAQGPAASLAGGSSSSGSRSSGSGSGAKKAGSWRDWCHRFDLLRPASDEGLAGCRAELLDCGSGSTAPGDAAASCSTQRLLRGAAAFVQSLAQQQQQQQQQQPTAQPAQFVASQAAAPPRGPQLVGRLAVLSLGSAGWQLGDEDPGGDAGGSTGAAGTAVVRALLQLKGLVRCARCAAVVSVPAALFSEADLARMQHLADGVIALESVADDSDIARSAAATWLHGLP